MSNWLDNWLDNEKAGKMIVTVRLSLCIGWWRYSYYPGLVGSENDTKRIWIVKHNLRHTLYLDMLNDIMYGYPSCYILYKFSYLSLSEVYTNAKFLTCSYILISFWRLVIHALFLHVQVKWQHPSAAYCVIRFLSNAAKIFIGNLISLI